MVPGVIKLSGTGPFDSHGFCAYAGDRGILTARCYAERGYEIACRLSVRL